MSREQDSVAVLYADRDHEQLGEHYTRHVAAMTAEGLYAKSDIAAELAWRDAEIERLTREAAPQASRYQAHVAMEREARAYREGIADAAPQHCEVCGFTKSGLPECPNTSTHRLTATDSAIQSQQGATGGADALLREVLDECAGVGCGPCVGSMAPFEDLCGRIERYLAHPQAAGSAPGEAEPTALIGFPEDKPIPGYDLIYPGTAKLPGFKYRPIWSMENHPDARRQRDKAPAPGAGSAPVGVEGLAERVADIEAWAWGASKPVERIARTRAALSLASTKERIP